MYDVRCMMCYEMFDVRCRMYDVGCALKTTFTTTHLASCIYASKDG